MGASVVARCDALPGLDFGEEVLDFVALAVGCLVIVERRLAAFGRWNAGLGYPFLQRVAKPVAVVAPVGDQGFRLWQDAEHELRALVIARLAFGKQHDQGLSGAVADDVQLGVQPAFRAPDTIGNIPFFRRLAAVRCAFRCVESIMMRSGLGPTDFCRKPMSFVQAGVATTTGFL